MPNPLLLLHPSLPLLSLPPLFLNLLSHLSYLLQVTAVHAPCDLLRRRAFWDSLVSTNNTPPPWGIIGDFNSILGPKERWSKSRFPAASSRDFHLFLSKAGLRDIGHTGSAFTWSNNGHGRRYVAARLDQMLVNQDWLNAFRDPTLTHLSKQTSDHSPILLSHHPATQKKRRFQFEKIWVSHPSFHELVASVWTTPVAGNPQYILYQKLKALR